MEILSHTFEPIFNHQSKILILGTFPSVISRKYDFYYGNPQNRFWKVISAITNSPLPITVEEKKNLLLNNQIALWDVIKSCTIKGSSDNSIENVVPVDLSYITSHSPITNLFANGSMAFKLYNQYCFKQTGIEAIKLPSTSPANASYTLESLIEHWQQIRL